MSNESLSASLESNKKIMKSASGKRPPDEAHGPGEETIRPQQCSEPWLLHLWNPIENHEKRFGQASSGQSTQCPGKEASQPHQLGLREPRKGSAHVHAALPAEVGTTLIQKMKCLRRGERRPEGAKKHAIPQVRVRTVKCTSPTLKFQPSFVTNFGYVYTQNIFC